MVQIIPYKSEHQEQVLNLILDIQRNEFDLSIAIEDQPDLVNISGFYQIENGNFWVALVSGEIVGTASLLRKMFVKQEYRGPKLSIARLLLSELLEWSRSKQITEIFLGTTHKFLAAHRFYEKNGFESVLKAMLPSSFPIMHVDTKFYRYLVSKHDSDTTS